MKKSNVVYMIIEQINLEKGSGVGLKMDMEHAPLLVIRAGCGFVMCGYLNMEIANKMGDVAVRVTGVRCFEDVLTAKAADVSEAAKKRGISIGMPAKEALNLMFQAIA
jgi:uncharacterized protein YunC (DUF1805 family)